jgi:hypothetical protein
VKSYERQGKQRLPAGREAFFSWISLKFDRRGLEFAGTVYYYMLVRAVKTPNHVYKTIGFG